jgi:hypothetical protein
MNYVPWHKEGLATLIPVCYIFLCGLSSACHLSPTEGPRVVIRDIAGARRISLIISPFEMVVSHSLVVAVLGLLSSCVIASALSWNATEYVFVFGDSYTTDGYNVSAGLNSPDPGYVSTALAFRSFSN